MLISGFEPLYAAYETAVAPRRLNQHEASYGTRTHTTRVETLQTAVKSEARMTAPNNINRASGGRSPGHYSIKGGFEPQLGPLGPESLPPQALSKTGSGRVELLATSFGGSCSPGPR